MALALKFEPFRPRTPHATQARRQLASFGWGRLARDPAAGPPIVLLDLDLSDRDMPRLHRYADAYVMASRGGGWGVRTLQPTRRGRASSHAPAARTGSPRSTSATPGRPISHGPGPGAS